MGSEPQEKKQLKVRGVFERPKGSNIWWINWHDHKGNRHRNKIGTLADAKRKRGEVKALVHKVKKKLEHPKALVDAGFLSPSAVGQAADLTLREFIRSCLPELKKHKSWKDQQRFARAWTKLIGDFKLSEIKSTHAVKRRTAKLEQGKSPATCNRETEFLRAILNPGRRCWSSQSESALKAVGPTRRQCAGSLPDGERGAAPRA